MQSSTAFRLAVWGDPIAHSRSPQLHTAAYGVLGLDWEYGRRQTDEASFPAALASLDASWRGLSLTMPLKEKAFTVAASRDIHAELTGAVNTLLLGASPRGFNTDVGGVVDALTEAGVAGVRNVRILGAGATAASAFVAACACGATKIDVRARRPERAGALRILGERLDVRVTVTAFEAASSPVDLTIATLPSGTALEVSVAEDLAIGGGTLFDAAYAPWPSALATVWSEAPAISGHGMLLHQALRQIRVFLNGDQNEPLPDEARVLEAMRAVI